MTADILHYIVEGLLSACLVWLAFRRAPGERARDSSETMHANAESARIAWEEVQKVKEKNVEMERRLTVVERKRFRCTMEFEIGDPSTVDSVEIVPIIPDAETKTVPSKKGKKA